jgi:hypothetical protein
MGTTSGRSGSHSDILLAVADRSVQATVIAADLLSWGDPFPFFPILFLGCPCGLLWCWTLLQKPALYRRKPCGLCLFGVWSGVPGTLRILLSPSCF